MAMDLSLARGGRKNERVARPLRGLATDDSAEEEGLDPRLLQAIVDRVWGRETVVRLRFEKFEAALGDLRVELDGDLRIKVTLGERSKPPGGSGGQNIGLGASRRTTRDEGP